MTVTEVLPWTHYRWVARSTYGFVLSGTVTLVLPLSRDDVEEHLLNRAAHMAVELSLPWNPFCVALAFKPIP